MQNMAENMFNRCQRDVCAEEEKKWQKTSWVKFALPYPALTEKERILLQQNNFIFVLLSLYRHSILCVILTHYKWESEHVNGKSVSFKLMHYDNTFRLPKLHLCI